MVREAGLAPHIKCFAHTLNLATQAGLSVPRVVCLLGRIRRIVNFFHRSPTATAVLAAKQKLLSGPDISEHKLIVDVTTHWNSSLDMLERYLDLQPAVAAALLSPEVCRNASEIADQADMVDADLQQPPLKKTALEDLLEGTFTESVGAAQTNHMCGIEAEIVRYRSEISISLTSCPLKWWKENSKIYPLLYPPHQPPLSLVKGSFRLQGML